MSRSDGSGTFVPRSLSRLVAALAACALAALAGLLMQPAAHAESATVTMSDGGGQTISITTGESVTFDAPTSWKGIPVYSGMTLSGPGVNTLVKPGGSVTIRFPSPGTANYAWRAKCVTLGHVPAGAASVQATDPPPPPGSSTPAGPGSQTSGPGGSTAPGGGSTGPGGSTAPAGSSAAGSPTPGASSSGAAGGGISLGPNPILNTVDEVPLGFNGPPADPNNPTPSIPNPAGTGTIPTGQTIPSVVPSTASSSRTVVEAAKASPASKTRPTGLAIASIGVLAIVSSLYAYRRLGDSAQRPGH